MNTNINDKTIESLYELESRTKLSERKKINEKAKMISHSHIKWLNKVLKDNAPDFRLVDFEYAQENTQLVIFMENEKTGEKNHYPLIFDTPKKM